MTSLRTAPATKSAEPLGVASDVTAFRASRWDRLRRPASGTFTVVALLVVWEVSVTRGWLDDRFLAAPSAIAAELVTMFATGSIWPDLAASGAALFLGLVLAIVVGVVIGVLYGWYRSVDDFLSPVVTTLYATPRIALQPVIILWLGIHLQAKVFIVFLSGLFEIILNTSVGVRTVDERFVRMARSYGVRDLRLFTSVALPHAIPYVLTGVRLAVGRGLVGVVVAELFAAQQGVGYVLIQASRQFRPDRMFAALVIITTTGVVLTAAVGALERRFLVWRTD